MNSDFPRIISLLRKEKKISQKQVAIDLGISQALLSHYEKGIRECGLDFVVKVADYYNVSCDYLLGRSADRTGLMIKADEIPEEDMEKRERTSSVGGFFTVLYKKLITNSINVMFDILSKMHCERLTREISSFLMISLYRAFRILYSADENNPVALFSLGDNVYKGYSDAAMNIAEANAFSIVKKSQRDIRLGDPSLKEIKPGDILDDPVAQALDSKTLQEQYPLFATSLLNLVKNSEDIILGEKEV